MCWYLSVFYPTLPKHQMSWDGKVIFCAYFAECKCHGLQVSAYSVRASKKVKKWKECQTLGRINDLSNVRVEAAEPLDNGLHPGLWKAKVSTRQSHNKNKNNNQKSHNNAWDMETWTQVLTVCQHKSCDLLQRVCCSPLFLFHTSPLT